MVERRVDQAARRLRRLLGDVAETGALPVRWRILSRGAEERIVAAYTSGARTFVGKFYPDRQGRRARRTLEALQARIEAGGGTQTLAIPTALAYEASCRCLLQTYAPGVPFDSLEDNAARAAFLRRAGRALSELHALPALDSAQRTLADHVAELIRPRPRRIGAAYPEYRPLIEQALSRLTRLGEEWRRVPVVPIHRDFHLRQLRLERDRMWVLDWDLAANGDPAFDLAYFLVYLRNHLPARWFPPAADSFLEGYVGDGTEAPLSRLRDYEIFNYLRRACRRFRLRDAGWEAEMRRMLERMRKALEGA